MVLKENDILKESIILFVSDHGDLMGDHNLFRKSMPYQGSIHVPFIVYDPGNHLNGGEKREPDNLVELRDIMPSLLDFCDMEIPDTVDGKSIKKIIENTLLPRKILERHRNYIIAAVEILSGEYPLLAEYLSFIRKVEM